ncbi:MAG: DUF418 domain-containing protein [Pseudomonadota bacterium]
MRDQAVDATRSLALWGIIIANMPFMAMPAGYGLSWWLIDANMADFAATFFIRTFVEGKFIGLFSLLFGYGIAQQIARYDAGYVYRRLLILALFGIAHAILLFPGDVLLPYAICGLVFVAFRHRIGTSLTPVIVGLSLATIGMVVLSIIALQLKLPAPDTAALISIVTEGSTAAFLTLNFQAWLGSFSELPLQLLFQIFACVALGRWVFQKYGSFRPFVDALIPYTTLLWSVGIGGNLIYGFFVIYGQVHDETAISYLAATLRPAFGFVLMLAFLVATYRMFTSSATAKLTSWLGQTGRASLSLYIGQAVAGVFIFRGFGLYGELSIGQVFIASIAIGLLLQLLALLWLIRFKLGPLEYSSRFLTSTTGNQGANSVTADHQ